MMLLYIGIGWFLSGLLSFAILVEAKKAPPKIGWYIPWVLAVIALGPIELAYLMCRLGAAAVRRLRRLK